MREALIVPLVAVALIGVWAPVAIGEGLAAPSGMAAELRNSIQRECAGRTQRSWPYGPDDELRDAVFDGRSTSGFLVRSAGSAVKPVAEQQDGLLVPADSGAGGVVASERTDRFVFCLLLNGYRWQTRDEDGLATLRRLADTGHRAAQATIGVAHFYGQFVNSDHNEAVRWFRRSAEQRHPRAQFYLGVAYANGEGVATDRQEAAQWLQKAAAQGDASAIEYLRRYARKLDRPVAPLTRHEVDVVRRRAEQGDHDAELALAVLYEDGRGVNRDIAEALRWYRAAAEGGNARAQNYLGEVYEKGRGIQQDDREAVAWYRRAAEQGDARAQYSLGVLLINGRGAARDDAQGWTWIERAAKRGHPAAQEVLRRKR